MKKRLILLLLPIFLTSCGEQIVGPKGVKGIQGIPGEQGPIGDQGPTGVQGDQGPQGIQGYSGKQGDKGPTGEKGETGDQGPQGDQGETGDKGPVGEQGETGDKGPQGEKGETGDAGITPSYTISISDDNYWVINGEKTDVIALGETGDVGDQGETGDKGAQGETYYGDLYSVIYVPCQNGYVRAEKSKYKVGEDVVIYYYPNEGYFCNWIFFNGSSTGYFASGDCYTIKMPERGLVVRAEFSHL